MTTKLFKKNQINNNDIAIEMWLELVLATLNFNTIKDNTKPIQPKASPLNK